MGHFAGAALTNNGNVLLWGEQNFGGHNNTKVDLTNIKAISMGGNAGALTNDGNVLLWGDADRGGSQNNKLDKQMIPTTL